MFTWLMTFVIWFVMVVPLRMLTDFGEPMIPTKEQLWQTYEEARTKQRTAQEQQLWLAYGGVLFTVYMLAISIVMFIFGLAPFGGLILVVVGALLSAQYCWKYWKFRE